MVVIIKSFLELKNELETGEEGNFYVFIGDDTYLKLQYVNKLGENWEELKSCAELQANLRSRRMFNSPVGYLLKDIEGSSDLNAVDIVEYLRKQRGISVVIIFNELSPDGALWESGQDYVVDFKKPKRGVLIRHVQSRVNGLSYEYASAVVDLCNEDLSRIEIIAHQLKNCSKVTPEVLSDVLLGDIVDAKEDLMLAWLNGHPEEIIDYLDNVGADELFRMLSQLYAVTRQNIEVLVHEGESAEVVSKKTDLSTSQVYRWRKYPTVFSVEQLVDRLLWVQALEGSVRTGALTKELAWHWLITHWFLN